MGHVRNLLKIRLKTQFSFSLSCGMSAPGVLGTPLGTTAWGALQWGLCPVAGREARQMLRPGQGSSGRSEDLTNNSVNIGWCVFVFVADGILLAATEKYDANKGTNHLDRQCRFFSWRAPLLVRSFL
jgi:hypothetical protein